MSVKKILWHSVAPWCPTGYGGQTNLFARRIAALDDVDLRISSTFGLEGHGMDWGGIWIYPGPGGPNTQQNWNQWVYEWSAHHQADLVITLMDVWPLSVPIFAEISKTRRLASWVPVDHKPTPPNVAQFFHQTGAVPIAMSRFGETELRDAGLEPLYVPHGVDTKVYTPRDGGEIRRNWGIPEDAFVVGMVANNQGQSPPRKAFSEAFMAFSVFRERHEDAILFMHAEMTGFRNGIDLFELAERFEIPGEAMKVSPPVPMENGISDDTMAELYSTLSVLLSPSYGEGFGVPIIESQSCGTPVIVTDWTSMPELCGAGWKVGGTPWDHTMAGAWWMKPDIGEIVDALEKAYEARDDQDLREKARAFALQYDADKVMTEYWMPVLEALDRPREVQPLRPNRAMQRAAEKAKVKVA